MVLNVNFLNVFGADMAVEAKKIRATTSSVARHKWADYNSGTK
jgi:hypothetical protein